MGNYDEIKAAVANVIKANGDKEITGEVMRNVLRSVINSLGAGAIFAGIATPSTNPNTPDARCFYLATEAGTYVNFGAAVLNYGEIAIITNETGNWEMINIDIAQYINLFNAIPLGFFDNPSEAIARIPLPLRKGGMTLIYRDSNGVRQRVLNSAIWTQELSKWQEVTSGGGGVQLPQYITNTDVEHYGGLFKAINYRLQNVDSYPNVSLIDCSLVSVPAEGLEELEHLNVSRATHIILPKGVIIFGADDDGITQGGNGAMIQINADNVVIEGSGRSTGSETDATTLRYGEHLQEPDYTTYRPYHIYSRGHDNINVSNLNLIGQQSTRGESNRGTHKLLGAGGIYIEKARPNVVESGNTCENIRLENLYISGTYAHAIYIDTPILSMIRNVRISQAGGHGIFINRGTTITLDSVYVSSAAVGGFVLYGVTYCTTLNCVAEYSGIGFWLRSVRNVTMFSPGSEELYNIGQDPWKVNGAGTNGLGLVTLDAEENEVELPDVNADNLQEFRGTFILITGGRAINIFTPYCIDIGLNTTNTLSYPSGTGTTNRSRFVKVKDECNALAIFNPNFTFKSSVSYRPKYDIEISSAAKSVNITWNLNNSTVPITGAQYISTDGSTAAPIYDASAKAFVQGGQIIYTNIELYGQIIQH